jgi:2-keto-4-pentenoate hydratase/2-oxohepta-3-ene-1,7-dioic acid hydratase in catechol pathway
VPGAGFTSCNLHSPRQGPRPPREINREAAALWNGQTGKSPACWTPTEASATCPAWWLTFPPTPSLPGIPRIGPPVGRVGNFIAIGLNYADHATETGAPIPPEPIIFAKTPSCIVGPNDDVVLHRGSTKTDWEVELAFVIGKRAEYVKAADAMDHVIGFTICNDVSERAYL